MHMNPIARSLLPPTRTSTSIVALAMCMISPTLHAQRITPVAALRTSADTTSSRLATPTRAANADAGRGMPGWVKWGLIGAAAGAVAFPLLGSMASDERSNPVKNAVAGAAAGFVVVGGSVALWQAVCGTDSSSRRAGLCGR
jgi:hypothetical protein